MDHEKDEKSAHIEHSTGESEGSEHGYEKVNWDARSITALLSLCLLWVGELSLQRPPSPSLSTGV